MGESKRAKRKRRVWYEERVSMVLSAALLLAAGLMMFCGATCTKAPTRRAKVLSEQSSGGPVPHENWRHISVTETETSDAEARREPVADATPVAVDEAPAQPTNSYIPEPATSSLLAAGCMWLLARRRRRR